MIIQILKKYLQMTKTKILVNKTFKLKMMLNNLLKKIIQIKILRLKKTKIYVDRKICQ
jgi:hypothetical protein